MKLKGNWKSRLCLLESVDYDAVLALISTSATSASLFLFAINGMSYPQAIYFI